jgi:hypothetical protein
MSRPIKDYLDGINDYIFLPGLQREFVWKPKQIASLFDSLIRGYPVGILTEWNVRGSKVEDFHSYQFLEQYITDKGRVPNEVKKEGFSRYNDRMPEDIKPDYLVIDGQQRLNSIFIGVRGEIADFRGGSGYSRDKPSNWRRKKLCIDLLGHPDFADSDVRGDYEFEFRQVEGFGWDEKTGYETVRSNHRLWMPVDEFWNGGLINQSEKMDIVDEYINSMPVDEETRSRLRDIASTVATDLYGEVLNDEIETDSVDHDTSEIPEIFQRLNTEGEDPKPYQLFMSKLMSYWPYAEEEEKKINPREKVEEWLEDFYQEFPEYENQIGRDLFMRYSAYLIKKDLLQSGLEHIGEDEMDELREKWLGGGRSATVGRFEWFRSGLAKSLETIIQVGIRPRILTHPPTIAMIGTFYYHNPEAEVNNENRNAVFRFLAQCLLLDESYSVFNIGNARSWMRYLNDHTDEYEVFPTDELLEHENLNPSREDIRLVVENASYSGDPGQPVFTSKNVAAILGLLDEAYTVERAYDISDYEVDHIYPRSREKEVEAAVGEEVDLNRIGNLQLLREEYNREKRDSMPERWFDDISDSEEERIRRVNRYPDMTLEPESAKEFIERREEELIRYLTDEYVR